MYEKYIGGLYAAIGCVLVFVETVFGVLSNREPMTFLFIFVIIVSGQILMGIGSMFERFDKAELNRKGGKMMEDLVDLELLEIKISHDGQTVWINNEERCLFRAQKIKQLKVEDERHA